MATAESVCVLGAGSWGTALALQLSRNGHEVRLWSHDQAQIAALATDRENKTFLPGFRFPEQIVPLADLGTAVSGVKVVLIVVPSHAFNAVSLRLAACIDDDCDVAWASKGLDPDTHAPLHTVAEANLGSGRSYAIVSGPTFAGEVAAGLPTAVAVASGDYVFAEHLAGLLHSPRFRIYLVTDMVGVEIGGAIKNVYAIAAGIADGLGFGANTRAAIITRGLAEMQRVGAAMGGLAETFNGLTGTGDMVLTCTDDQSRNRRFGLLLATGRTREAACAEIGQVVEGINTAREAYLLAAKLGVNMPIARQVYGILYEDIPVQEAVEELLSRDDIQPER